MIGKTCIIERVDWGITPKRDRGYRPSDASRVEAIVVYPTSRQSGVAQPVGPPANECTLSIMRLKRSELAHERAHGGVGWLLAAPRGGGGHRLHA